MGWLTFLTQTAPAAPSTGKVAMFVDAADATPKYVDDAGVVHTLKGANGTGSGTVMSVGLSAPAPFNVTGSPITASGTLALTLTSQSAGTFLAAPSGAVGVPVMRVIADVDIPGTLVRTSALGVTVATLSGGKLDPSQVPAIAITETFVVADETAMLACAAERGDVAVRMDVSKSFILSTEPASTPVNWQELLTPSSPVSSVFGRVGAVAAASGDYNIAQITGLTGALAAKLDATANAASATKLATSRTINGVAFDGTANIQIGQPDAVTALTISGGAVAIDCALGDTFTLALTANVTTVTFSGLQASGKPTFAILRITQDATGGRTITWPSSVKWAGTAYVPSAAANAVDTVGLMTLDAGTTWQGVASKGFA